MIRDLVLMGEASAIAPTTWDLTVVTTGASQDYTVNIAAGNTVNITIDWGDTTSDVYNTTGQKTHIYAAAGTYTVKISGSFSSSGNIRLGSNGDNRSRLKGTGVVCEIPGLDSFNATFRDCFGLTGAIPADLFRYNTSVSTYGFGYAFFGCSGLTGAIPADLFRYNTYVSTYGFNATFYGCSGLTGAIPADLFRYNTSVSTYGFAYAFHGCSGLTGAIPADLFRYNTSVSTYGFYATFRGCNNLELSPYIFFAAGEESTRFLNRPSDFYQCFYRTGAYAGNIGTAPALWSCNFGTATPVTTQCFTGHSTSTVDNFAAIPAGWK